MYVYILLPTTVTIPVSLADPRWSLLSLQKSKFFDCLTLQLLKSENFQLIFARFCSLIFLYGNQHKIEGFPSFRVTGLMFADFGQKFRIHKMYHIVYGVANNTCL